MRYKIKRSMLFVAALLMSSTVLLGQATTPNDQAKGAALGVLLRRNDDHVKVVGVIPGSGAARAGVRWGDELLSLGDHSITRIRHVTEVLNKSKPGDQIDVKVDRKGKILNYKATLGTEEGTFGKTNQGHGGTPSIAPVSSATVNKTQSPLSQKEITALNQQIYLLNQQIDLLHRQLNQVQTAPQGTASIDEWWKENQRGETDDDPALFQ